MRRWQGLDNPNTTMDVRAKVIAPPADGFRRRQGCAVVLGNRLHYCFQRLYAARYAAIVGQLNRSD